MSAQEQVIALYHLGKCLYNITDTSSSVFKDVRAFLANEKLCWAHIVIPSVCSYWVESRVKQLEGGDSRLLHETVYLFKKMVQSSLLDRTILDIYYNTFLNLANCTSEEGILSVKHSHSENVLTATLSLLKQKWNGMTAQEQAKHLYAIGECTYNYGNLALNWIPLVEEFLRDDSLIWASKSMRTACSWLVQVYVRYLNNNSTTGGWNAMYDVVKIFSQLVNSSDQWAFKELLEQFSKLNLSPSQ